MPTTIYTWDAHNQERLANPVDLPNGKVDDGFLQNGLFTSDGDLAGLPGADDDARAQAYVEAQLVIDPRLSGPATCRVWRQHLEPWSRLDEVPADLTWTFDVPEPGGGG